MDWIISLSKAERDGRALSPETAEAVYRALHVSGVAILRGLFSSGVTEGLYKEYMTQFGAMNASDMNARVNAPPPHSFMQVGGKRFDVAPRMVGAFADPAIFADPLLLGVLYQLLGSDMRLGGLTVVASFPGASLQRHHRDHPHLFPQGNLGSVLPPHAINVAVPLVDVDVETGPTGIWLGSHRWPETREPQSADMTIVPYQRGDGVLLDYRMLHSGLPNQSERVRPILYMTYSRTWFFDETNYKSRTSLDISLETFLSLPEAARHLLWRAYAQIMRSRQAADPEPRVRGGRD